MQIEIKHRTLHRGRAYPPGIYNVGDPPAKIDAESAADMIRYGWAEPRLKAGETPPESVTNAIRSFDPKVREKKVVQVEPDDVETAVSTSSPRT